MLELNWIVRLNRRIKPAMWEAVGVDSARNPILDHNNDPAYRRFFFTKKDAEWFVNTTADIWAMDRNSWG
jgi:hypothetical protein